MKNQISSRLVFGGWEDRIKDLCTHFLTKLENVSTHLRNANSPASLDKILNVTPAFGYSQFGHCW